MILGPKTSEMARLEPKKGSRGGLAEALLADPLAGSDESGQI